MDLVIASFNRSKSRHLRDCIKSIRQDIDIRSFTEFSQWPTFEDKEGQPYSLEEIAVQKARFALGHINKPCLVDETLLIVPALGTSAEALSQKKRSACSQKMLPDTKTLMNALKNKENMQRDAYLETVLALAIPGVDEIYTAICRQEGYLSEQERGTAAFDFSTIFLKHEYNKTLAELSDATLVRISHRKKGLERLLSFLKF